MDSQDVVETEETELEAQDFQNLNNLVENEDAEIGSERNIEAGENENLSDVDGPATRDDTTVAVKSPVDDVENNSTSDKEKTIIAGIDGAQADNNEGTNEDLSNPDDNKELENADKREETFADKPQVEMFVGEVSEDRGESHISEISKPEEDWNLGPHLSSKDISELRDYEDDELKTGVELKKREELMEQYTQSVNELKAARELNLQLQTKLAEYFRRKKADASDQQSITTTSGGSVVDTGVDYEQRYTRYISSLVDLHQWYEEMKISYSKQIDELRDMCDRKQKEVDEAYNEFMNFKYNIGKKALHSQTGKPINPKELSAVFDAEKKKEALVREVRLENIKLKNEVLKVEALLKSKEELSEGLHLIDFEQLKIENQTYNEKIDERNEELSKLRRKISNTVQIMTHIKEKLQAVQNDNAKQKKKLDEADEELTLNRDRLTKMKQTRELLRAENARLRRSCGLLGKNALLLNYEDSYDSVLHKRQSLEETKQLTANYQLKTQNLAQKIRNVQNNKTGF
uniref:CCDC113/CCDC96 coiled-coil domain-containing protein n=2 Tax=Trichobilharzia regenti TaxID=157069 RepID=A0AA85KC43_TRIRE|nr:unnamed protein product [Trichobilharzia regenti]